MLSKMKNLPPDTVYDQISTPVGNLWLIASLKGLHAILWEKDSKEADFQVHLKRLKKAPQHSVIKRTRTQLKQYFSGKRSKFDIPLVLDGTFFQKQAWKQLQKIPYGKTISYQKQAERLGDAKKARAVGGANAKNPISIIVPCHRVIAKTGALHGFGGGLETKKKLLEIEQSQRLEH